MVKVVVGAPVPRPERATVWGLLLAVSVKASVALSAPTTLGAKIMLTLQGLLGVGGAALHASVVIWKSPAFVPETSTLETVMADPLLLRVMAWFALVEFTGKEPKLRLGGLSVTVPLPPEFDPVPESETA